MTGLPQKETLDRAAYTCMLVSYRRLPPQFQFSLSGVTLVYLSQWFLVVLLDRVEQLGSYGMGRWESTEKQHCKMVQLKSTVEQLGCCRTAEDSSWNTGEIGQLKSTVEIPNTVQ